MTSSRTLLARQPIYNQDLKVAAYELLFRPIAEGEDEDWDADAATTEVIVHTFAHAGLQNIADDKPTYINFTMNWLKNAPPFPPEQVIIELDTPEKLDEAYLSTIQKLREQRFQIGLDDFNYRADLEPLLDLVDAVKIDMLACSEEEIDKSLQALNVRPVVKVAKRIETYRQLETCISQQFDLFQGFFLCRPQTIKGKALPSNRLVVMELLSELQNPDVEVDQLEQIIGRDPALSFKIIKVINSAQYARGRSIDSIHQAIVILGLSQLKAWGSVLALSQLSDKPSALLVTAMSRARMCELIAKEAKLEPSEAFFTAGMFSTLDAFFDQNLIDILGQLPLSPELSQALLNHEGTLGIVLQTVIRHERADWDNIDWPTLKNHDITDEAVEKAYLEAMQWSQDICKAFDQG